MSLELLAANLTLQGRADRLSRLDPGDLRKEALRAARDSDVEALWGLLEAYLVTHGSRGARQHAYAGELPHRAGGVSGVGEPRER